MIIYKTSFNSSRSDTEILKSLSTRVLSSKELSKIYVFPFSLFSKDFRNDLRKSPKMHFKGKINNNKFKLYPSSIIFSTRRWTPILIEGSVDLSEIRVTYSLPFYYLLLGIIFSLLGLAIHDETINSVYFSLIVFCLFVLLVFFRVIRIHNVIQRICRKV